MCYYTLVESKKERLELAFRAEFYPGADYEPKGAINGFDHQRLPIIMNDNSERIALVRWGLIPTWATTIEQAKKLQNNTLNARAETIVEKPAFRYSQNQRCLVLVDGFYEWQHQSNKNKVKHLIKLKDEESFALGGIWSYWKNPLNNSFVRTFAILTVEANEMMAKIHNTKQRMPLIISKENYKDWLNPEAKDLSYLIRPFDEKLMVARVVF